MQRVVGDGQIGDVSTRVEGLQGVGADKVEMSSQRFSIGQHSSILRLF